MQPFQVGQPMQPTQPQRPSGITIIAVLAIIEGVSSLIVGISGTMRSVALLVTPRHNIAHNNTGSLLIFSLIIFVIGIGYLIFGIGALQLQPWSWVLGMILEGLIIIFNVVELALARENIVLFFIHLTIAGVIIYFLLRAQIQLAFGRVPQ